MNASTWERLMGEVVEAAKEQADYSPGSVNPPGSGTTGDDPAGAELVARGPLAFVCCEALISAVHRGADRDALVEAIAQAAGTSTDDVEAVLSGENRDPDPDLITAFATALQIDAALLMDAAVRGGAKLPNC